MIARYNYILIIVFLLLAVELRGQNDKNILRVKYVSTEHVYLDGGKLDGLAVGDTLEVHGNTDEKILLEVVYVARHSASCKKITGTNPVKAGDTVSVTNIPEKGQEIFKRQTRKRNISVRAEKKRSSPSSSVRGTARIQWYQFTDEDKRFQYREPSFRLNLKIINAIKDHVSINIRTRTRYHERTGSGYAPVQGSELRNRIYEVSLSYDDPESSFKYRAGRLISSKISGIGYVDGVSFEYEPSTTLNWGVFGGFQPEWHYSEFQTKLQKYGSYIQLGNGRQASVRARTTLSVAGEYRGTEISREFIYIQGQVYNHNTWNLYQNMELDINRQWRKDKTDQVISISRIFISGRYRISDYIKTNLSLSRIRNYYSYEYRNTADSLFDQSHRNQARIGLYFTPHTIISSNWSIGLRSLEGITPNALSWSGNFSLRNYPFHQLTVLLRINGFSGNYARGLYPNLKILRSFRGGHRAYISYGVLRYEMDRRNRSIENYWVQVGSDMYMWSHWHLSWEAQYDWGDSFGGNRLRMELGYRF